MERVMGGIFRRDSKLGTCPPVSVYDDLCKAAADELFSKGKDLDGIFLLSETHALYLRHKAETYLNHLSRVASRASGSETNYRSNLFDEKIRSAIGFRSLLSAAKGEGIKMRLKELPQEWTIVQVTSAFDLQFSINPEKYRLSCPPSLYISRMECGPNPNILLSRVDLYPRSKSSSEEKLIPKSLRVTKSFLEELNDIITDQNKVLTAGKKFQNKEYWLKRAEHNQRMKVLLGSIESQWLRGWKSLFLGKLVNPEDVKKLEEIVEEMLSPLVYIDFSARTRSYLTLIIGAMPNLEPREIHRILCYVLPDSPQQEIFDIMDAIEGVREKCTELKPCKWMRHPVILILDKRIGEVPWEMLPTLEGHPYSRAPSIHFIHSLYFENCKNEERASVSTSRGYYVVNPDGTLPDCEQRVVPYLERRPEKWSGKKGVGITPAEFTEAIKDHEVVLYSGHGSGEKYMHQVKWKGAMFLMGCSSVSTHRLAAHLDPWGAVYKRIIGLSPSTIGMLWPVTSQECDKMTIKLLDLWLGSAPDVKDSKEAEDSQGKKLIKFASRAQNAKWNVATVKTFSPNELSSIEGDLLRSMTEARYAPSQFMTSAAMVAYGIPVCASKADSLSAISSQLSKVALK